MKLTCIIVEDEPLSRDFLERFCTKSNLLTVKQTFPNAEDALAYLRENEIELVFLDVEMPGINGFQLLDQLPYMPKVIMTTSKTDYAYTAFEYKVVDFLKKPIQYNRFLDAVDKVIEIYKTTTADAGDNDIFIKSEGKYTRLSYDDILFIEGMGDYVKYVTAAKKYITHSTMKAVAEKMEKHNFIKVHRSYIVNIKKIKDIQDNSLLIEGTVIPISKANKTEVLEKLKII
jgi:two-component system, LytTR family, response regulator